MIAVKYEESGHDVSLGLITAAEKQAKISGCKKMRLKVLTFLKWHHPV